MAAYTDLTIDQGANFQTTIDLTADDGSPINITGYEFSGQIRKSHYSSNATASFIITVISAAGGNTAIRLDSATTANIAAGRYVYDIKMKDLSNVSTRIVEGIVTVTPQATR